MASVRVDKPGDARFKLLGKLLGTGHHDAKGKMLDIWEWCTERDTYFLQPEIIDAISERDGFTQLLITADLGEMATNGLVRVKGTKGRVEWLGSKRRASMAGGNANKKRIEEERAHEVDHIDEVAEHIDIDEQEPKDSQKGATSEPSGSPLTLALSPVPTTSLSNSPSGVPQPRAPNATWDVWVKYSTAYARRHGIGPPKNDKSMAHCKQLVARLGLDAPEVASFFLTHTDRTYVLAKHPLNLLVRDAERIYTEWKTGRKGNSITAKDEELQATNVEAVQKYLERKGTV